MGGILNVIAKDMEKDSLLLFHLEECFIFDIKRLAVHFFVHDL